VRSGSLSWCGAGLAIAVLLFASRVHAGNGDGVLLGNEAAMSAGAIVATVSDGNAVWYNPAGLAGIWRDAIDVSGNAFQVRAAEEDGLIRSTTGESNDGGYLELLSIPSAVTLARRVDPNLTLAFGIFAPRFTQHTVRTGLDVGEAPDHPARFTLSSAENRATFHAGGAFGLRLSPEVRFGMSLFGVYREIYEAFQTAGQFLLEGGLTRLIANGGIRHVRSLGLELGAGLQIEPHPGVLIAVTARSPSLEILTQIRETSTTIDALVSDVASDGVTFVPEDEEDLAPGIAVLTPGRFTFALGFRFSRGWIAGEIDVQPPLELDPVVHRRMVWNVRVGGRYLVDDRTAVGFGAFTDHSEQEPIARLASTNVDFYGLTLGVEYRTPHALGEATGPKNLVFSTTVAARYAVGTGRVGGLQIDPELGTLPDVVPVATTIHEIGLHIGSALYF
jgi:hypothetical protein